MTVADAVPPPFSAAALLHGWSPEPLVMVPIIAAGVLYLIGFRQARRQPGPAFPVRRVWAFGAGLAVLVIAVNGPFETYSPVDLAVHMAKHMLMLTAVPVLIVLGSPLTLAQRAVAPTAWSRFADPVVHSRVAHALTRPWAVGVLYTVDLVVTHFTGFYSLALENHYLHDLEHLSYLAVGILASTLILGFGTARLGSSYPQRVVVVVLLMPVMSIISLVFILASHPLYQYYAALPAPWGGRAHAMADQALAGAIMWIPSGLLSLAAVIYITVDWFRKEEADQALLEALEDARQRPVA